MTALPISPREASKQISITIPDEVVEAFNDMINETFNGRTAKFTQNQVIDRIILRFLGKRDITREEIFKGKWLDVEPIFASNGWIVYYDKPAYNESYEATFEFRAEEKA